MSRSARCAVLVVVLVAHGLVVVFLARNTAKRFVTRVEEVVSTHILVPLPVMPPEQEPTTARAPAREPQSARTPAPPRAQPEPITVEPLADEPLPWIDWQASAERAAATVTQPSPYRQFGRPDVMPRGPVRSPSTGRPIGEIYRDGTTGEIRKWISEDCYQVLGSAPPAGVQDDFASHLPSRVMCSLKSKKPRGDLFKDLPAYKRHLLPESRQR
jgi:hypothetical protein